jgi:hypothetical protein
MLARRHCRARGRVVQQERAGSNGVNRARSRRPQPQDNTLRARVIHPPTYPDDFGSGWSLGLVVEWAMEWALGWLSVASRDADDAVETGLEYMIASGTAFSTCASSVRFLMPTFVFTMFTLIFSVYLFARRTALTTTGYCIHRVTLLTECISMAFFSAGNCSAARGVTVYQLSIGTQWLRWMTGASAKAWCLLIDAEASVSLTGVGRNQPNYPDYRTTYLQRARCTNKY